MHNNNTTIHVYNAVVTVNGTKREVLVGAERIDWESTGIGTRSFLRETLRTELGASSVRVGNRVGVLSPTTARQRGVKVYSTSAKKVGKAINSRDTRAEKRQTFEASKANEVKAPSQTAMIRAWAKQNGYDVADRGRLSKDIVAEYEATHGMKATKVKKSKKADATAFASGDIDAGAFLSALSKKERKALLMQLLTSL